MEILLEQEEKKEIKTENKPTIVKIKEFVFQYWEFRLNGYTLDLEYRSLIDEDDQEFKTLDDFAFNDIVYYLKESGFKSRISDDLKTILFSSQVGKHFMIKNFLEAQPKYGGTSEIDKWADMIVLKEPDRKIYYSFAEQNEVITYQEAKRLLLKKWLIACVHSSLGLKPNDVMLILISDQGKFKTSFLNFLCPKDLSDYLFTGHIVPSITENNTANLLAEKLFINVDDQMEQVFGKEFNAMKAIISADSVTNRKVYKKFAPKRKRIANFIGSVNNSQFLTDNENRRYLCLEIEEINSDYENIDINRLWAEAYQLANKTKIYKNIVGIDRALINAISLNFTAPTIEQEYLTTLFESTTDTGDPEILYMKSSEILKIIQMVSGSRTVSSYRLNTALRREKYLLKPKRLRRLGDVPYKVYLLKPRMSLVAKSVELNFDLGEFKHY